jgi:hypothetical protein
LQYSFTGARLILYRLAKQFFSTIIAITATVTSIVTQAPNANANEVRTISKNGISLNANPTYGYKHGAIKVSQYFTSNYVDNEQRWEIIPIGSGKSILRNIEYNKCFNSYQTQVGSTPNLYPCDGNDSDQQVILNGDSIIHAATGLQLNLGDRNDTPVVWKSGLNEISKVNNIVNEYYDYEYWIVASGFNLYPALFGLVSGTELNSMPGSSGHAFNGLIRRKITKFKDGTSNISNWEAWKTFGLYGHNQGGKYGLRFDYQIELLTINKILNGDTTINGKFEIRKSKVSFSRANWIINNYNVAGCDENGYNVIGVGDQCNCVIFASRSWDYFTAHQENFKPNEGVGFNFYNRSPEDLANQMRYKRYDKNSQFNNENVWE